MNQLVFTWVLFFLVQGCHGESSSPEKKAAIKKNNDEMGKPAAASKSAGCQEIALKDDRLGLQSQNPERSSFTKQVNRDLSLRFASDSHSKISVSVSFRERFRPEERALELHAKEKNTAVVKFKLQGIEFCQGNLLVSEDAQGLRYIGNIPEAVTKIKSLSESIELPVWSALSSAKERLIQAISQNTILQSKIKPSTEILQAVKCLDFNTYGFLVGYWNIDLKIDGVLAGGIANETEVLSGRDGPIYYLDLFDASGEASVIKRKQQADRNYLFLSQKIKLSNIGEGAYLCNQQFAVDSAFHERRLFNFDAKSPEGYLQQVTMFHNADEHSSWLQNLPAAQGRWAGPQLRLVWEPKFRGAVYKPDGDFDWGGPLIMVGDSGGFQNTANDPEVVAHELGHHLIYRTIRKVVGTAKILHEGLADYFVFARTNNPELAETVCTKDLLLSGKCESPSYMRSANNKLTYETVDLRNAHTSGQLVSGLMWDIGQELGQSETASLTWQALGYLTGNSDFSDFFMALMEADRDLNKGVNACTIKSKGITRGFAQLISPIECKSYLVK